MTDPYTVYPTDSPPGRAVLARRGVTAEDLARAVAEHGGGGAHQNMPPTLVLNYIIKT